MHGFGLYSHYKNEWYHAKNHMRVCSCNWTVPYVYIYTMYYVHLKKLVSHTVVEQHNAKKVLYNFHRTPVGLTLVSCVFTDSTRCLRIYTLHTYSRDFHCANCHTYSSILYFCNDLRDSIAA